MATAVAVATLITTVAATYESGRQQQYATELEARQMEQQAERERLASSQREVARLQELKDVLGSQRALFASRNISISSGTPQTLAGESKEAAMKESAIDKLNTGLRYTQNLSGAQQSKTAGQAARYTSYLGMSQSVFEQAAKIKNRGGPQTTGGNNGSAT